MCPDARNTKSAPRRVTPAPHRSTSGRRKSPTLSRLSSGAGPRSEMLGRALAVLFPIGVHTQHALLERARACASSLAKRVSSPEKLETAMKSEITARSAESRTDSEVAFSPSSNLIDGVCDAPGHPANRLVEDAAADRLDFRPNLGLVGPAVRSPFGDPVLQQPIRRRQWRASFSHCWWILRSWGNDSVAIRHRGSCAPDARFSARGSGWPARPRGVRKQWNACSGRSRCSEAKRRQMSVDVSFQKGSRVARAAIVNEFFSWRTEQTAFPAPLERSRIRLVDVG